MLLSGHSRVERGDIENLQCVCFGREYFREANASGSNRHHKLGSVRENLGITEARLTKDSEDVNFSPTVLFKPKLSKIPRLSESFRQQKDQASRICNECHAQGQCYRKWHQKLDHWVSTSCLDSRKSVNILDQMQKFRNVRIQDVNCPSSHGTNTIDLADNWLKSNDGWRPSASPVPSTHSIYSPPQSGEVLECDHTVSYGLSECRTRSSSEYQHNGLELSHQIPVPMYRFTAWSVPPSKSNMGLRYLRIPTDLRNRIYTLERRVAESRLGHTGKCARIGNGDQKVVDMEPSDDSYSRLGHHMVKLPREAIAAEFGYPEQDSDIDDCFADPHGLSQAGVRCLKQELSRYLGRIRAGALESITDMQLILGRQARFRDFSEAEVRDHMFYIIRRFVSARNQAVEKFRVYVRNRRWIENTTTRERQGFLSRRQNNVLRSWLFANFQNPYPNADDRRRLVAETRLNVRQINNWLINARSRIWKPTVYHMANKNPQVKGMRCISTHDDLNRSRM